MDYAEAYRQLHRKPRNFRGYSIKSSIKEIAALVEKTGAKTLLDYGCGKGQQYSKQKVHEQWGGIMPTLYDVGLVRYSEKPKGTFHGVICTDVMEHIEEADVDEILSDVISYASRFVLFYIACRPSKRKRLKDGRDVHVTIKPPEWWHEKIAEHAPYQVEICVKYDTRNMA